jgi:hypothetical protein
MLVFAWKSYEGSSYTSYQVIVELTNSGTGWAQLSPFNSDYTILDPSGGVVTTGSFTYAYPEYLGPGQVGYLIEDSVEDNVPVANFASVDASARYDVVDAPGATFTFSGLTWKKDSIGSGLVATGFLVADRDVRDASVGVVCLNADGAPIGATTTNLVQNVTSGAKKGFETIQETPPLKASACASTVGFAQDTGF